LLKSVHSTAMNYVPQIVYDAAGRVEEMDLGSLSPESIALEKEYTYYDWDTQGGRLNTLSSALQTLTYTYDGNGNITQMIDARQSGSETLEYTYDSLNRLKTVNGAYAETSAYDSNGRIVERSLPNDPGTMFSDDFSSKDLQNWWWSSYTTIPFDLDNQRVVKSSPGSALNYYNSGFQRITALSQDTTVDLRFKLTNTDTHARFYFGLSPVRCDGGGGVIMSADASGLKTLPTPIITEVPPICYQYYDQAGVEEVGGKLYFFVSYAGIGESSSSTRTLLLDNVQADTWYKLKIYRGTGNNSSQLTITVTKESNPIVSGTVTQTVSGGIDWHLRHVTMLGTAYIDDYSERTGVIGYSYADQPHAVSSIEMGGVSIRQYTYDDNGNMTQRVEGSDTYTFAYDKENRLISGIKNSVTLASYTYDGDGKRVKAQEGGFTTYYIGDYYEWRNDSTTTTAVKYYYAAGQRIAMRKAGTLTWLLGDHLGSTTITANENGTLATEQTYTAWGQTRSGSLPTDRQYTGQINESELGLYFYNARFYDPYITQFTQPDSIIPDSSNPLEWNRYSYVRHNPINSIDPTGHKSCSNGGEDFDSCGMDAYDEYQFLKQHYWKPLSEDRNPATITGGVTLFYEGVRDYLFINFGTKYLTKSGKIQDKALIAIILRNEVYDFRKVAPNQYWAAISAISNQYNSNRYLWPGAGPICEGNCSQEEQIQWLRDFSATWNFKNLEEWNPLSLATDGAWLIIYPEVILEPTGNYWAWGNTLDPNEADKYPLHTGPILYGDSYFYVYGYPSGWSTTPTPQ